jgi:hypothetical protein
LFTGLLTRSSLLVSGREEKILEEVEGVEQVKDYVTHTAENSYLCNICGKGRRPRGTRVSNVEY